jgi:hypothetical protein
VERIRPGSNHPLTLDPFSPQRFLRTFGMRKDSLMELPVKLQGGSTIHQMGRSRTAPSQRPQRSDHGTATLRGSKRSDPKHPPIVQGPRIPTRRLCATRNKETPPTVLGRSGYTIVHNKTKGTRTYAHVPRVLGSTPTHRANPIEPVETGRGSHRRNATVGRGLSNLTQV